MLRSLRRRALADQVLALLGSMGGFPASTRQIATQLGEHLVAAPAPQRPLPPRPACWPEDLDDPGDRTEHRCVRCGCWHRQPVWRRWTPEDVRPLLAHLADAGLVERVVVDGWRQHYWRHSGGELDVCGEVG